MGIQGRFVLSYNDCPFIRELYQGFTVEPLVRQNNLKPGEEYRELLIRNYEQKTRLSLCPGVFYLFFAYAAKLY